MEEVRRGKVKERKTETEMGREQMTQRIEEVCVY